MEIKEREEIMKGREGEAEIFFDVFNFLGGGFGSCASS